MAPRKKPVEVAPPAAPDTKEFDLFGSEAVTEAAPIDPATIAPSEEEAAAAPKEEAKPTVTSIAPSKKECNEACPKFHRPDPECVKCFNEHFRR